MEWERAKTILITVLALLNLVLLALNLSNAQGYKISAEDLSQIEGLLAKSEISLACELPQSHEPMHLANLSAPYLDYDYLESCFFPDAQDIIRTNEAGNVIYQSGENSLIMPGAALNKPSNSFVYHAAPTAQTTAMDSAALAEYARSLLGQRFRSFRLTNTFQESNSTRYLYNDQMKNTSLFCSYLQITVKTDGGFTIKAQKYDFASYAEGAHDIFRIDEALLCFLHYAKGSLKKPIVITGVDLGYDMDSSLSEDMHKAKPYYRLFVQGLSEPLYIDAFTNTMVQNSDALVR